MQRDEQPVRVEDRQCVQEHVARPNPSACRTWALDGRLRCVIMAPLERPVVPEV